MDRLSLEWLTGRVRTLPLDPKRRIVAIAGPPGSGKSLLADRLCEVLNNDDTPSVVLPMDGFHLDNRLLEPRGMLARKGAPETFDATGFLALVSRLHEEGPIILPVFDRDRDLAIAGARELPAACSTVIVEGNYLLFDAPVWRDLAPLWGLSIYLDVPQDVLRTRLVQRWLDQGLEPDAARARAEGNDLANAARIAGERLAADLVIEGVEL